MQLLSGNEAVAQAARDAGVALGTGYPGTPSTEILEHFDAIGGHAEWAPNEKVAFEVALGAAFGSAAALVTMKHVGLNVAADPLFTAAYSGVAGALLVVSADDPGMASSQNEQDNRRYAVAAVRADVRAVRLARGLRLHAGRAGAFGPLAFAGAAADDNARMPLEDAREAADADGVAARAALRAGHPRACDDSGPRPACPPSPAAQAGGNRRVE